MYERMNDLKSRFKNKCYWNMLNLSLINLNAMLAIALR